VTSSASTSTIHFGSSEYWGALTKILMPDRIYAGLRVEVTGGRKHKGRTGVVTRHQRSAYEQDVFRYASGASLDLRIMLGRDGFAALVTPDEGAPFWIPCKYLMPASSAGGAAK
jgi:hypothetical protein